MIKFSKVNLRFGEKTIFSDFSTTVPAGAKILFNSRSGTGKSSFLKMVVGFCMPDAGEVTVNKLQLNIQNIRMIRTLTSYIPQQITLPDQTAEQFISDICSFEINSGADKQLFYDFLDKFEIPAALQQNSLSTFSGGERQRVAIAASLALNRKILLLDEAVSALDPKMRRIVIREIELLDATVITVSHNSEWLDNGIFQKGVL